MTKYFFKPESVDFIPSLPLIVAIIAISVFSSAALDTSHGFVDRVACSCLTILVSNFWYLVLTGMQCMRFRLHSLWHKIPRRQKKDLDTKKREAVIDDRRAVDDGSDIAQITGQCSVEALLCRTIEFRHGPREVRLFVSRKELWYILYPMSFAVFVLFYCIPIYDLSCMVSLVMGLMTKSSYDEYKRGIYWKRSTGRKVVFVFVTLCGLVCTSSLFVLGSVVARHGVVQHRSPGAGDATTANTTAAATPSPASRDATNMLGTLLHTETLDSGLRRGRANGSSSSSSDRNESETSLQDDIDLMHSVQVAFDAAYSASVQTPNLTQMLLVWSVCWTIPFFLGRTPESIRLPVVLEIMQPSLSCLASVVLCVACIVTPCGWMHRHLLNSPVFVAYVSLVAPAVWCAVYFLIKASRSRTTGHVCCILVLAAYIKLLHLIQARNNQSRAVQQVSVFVGCMCGLYAALMVLFIRMENKSIQMGWDTDQDEDDDRVYMSDGIGMNRGLSDDRQADTRSPRYCIEDVLERVTSDIEATELILSKTNSASVVLTKPVEVVPAPAAISVSVSLGPIVEQNEQFDAESDVEEGDVEHALLPETGAASTPTHLHPVRGKSNDKSSR